MSNEFKKSQSGKKFRLHEDDYIKEKGKKKSNKKRRDSDKRQDIDF